MRRRTTGPRPLVLAALAATLVASVAARADVLFVDDDAPSDPGPNDPLVSSAILTSWGFCPGCAADVDGDDTVDFADLLLALSTWGSCP
jgi:hypothetical protein